MRSWSGSREGCMTQPWLPLVWFMTGSVNALHEAACSRHCSWAFWIAHTRSPWHCAFVRNAFQETKGALQTFQSNMCSALSDWAYTMQRCCQLHNFRGVLTASLKQPNLTLYTLRTRFSEEELVQQCDCTPAAVRSSFCLAFKMNSWPHNQHTSGR